MFHASVRIARTGLRFVSSAIVLCAGLLTTATIDAQSSDELFSARLLFEPRPIPEAGTAEPAFVSLPVAAGETTAPNENTDNSEAQARLEALLAIDEDSGTADERLQRMLDIGSLNVQLGRPEDNQGMESRVLQLIQQAYGQDRLAAANALQRVGDWNLQAFLDRSSILLNVPRLNVNSYVINGPFLLHDLSELSNAGNSPLQHLYYAKGNFLNALNNLTQLNDYTNPALFEIERKFQTVLFLSTHRENIAYDPDFYLTRRATETGSRLNKRAEYLNESPDYDDGSLSFERTLTYVGNNRSRTPAQIVNTLLEEADWDLLYARADKAEEKYASAFEYFDSTPVLLERANELIYPEVPVVLPTFLPAPNSREKLGIAADQAVDYVGYVDVSFSITNSGRANKIALLDRGGSVTDQMETRLKKYLANVYFRPRYAAGKLDNEPLRLRYYIGY